MLHLNDLTYRIDGKLILDHATAGIPTGHKVGLVGRNGSGKTTLLRLITGEIQSETGAITTAKHARIGIVAQEAPGGPENLIDTVLEADLERASLMREAETALDPMRIAQIHERLADIDAHTAPARASAILTGLGFDEAAQQRPCAEYSGGWRMRVALAAALFAAPEVLLLDEPTNYLDLEGALWLENFIEKYPHTILIVSHDRDLLNTAVTHILHLDRGKLTLYTGGYDDFEEIRRERQRLELRLKAKQDDERRHMEEFVNRFRAKATKARQAQSRLKALARMKPIAAQVENAVAPFRFPAPAKQLGNPLIRIEGASVGYVEESPVLQRLDLRLDEDDRIGLLGANGNGKSTLAKFLCGRMDTMAGSRRASKKLEYGYFAQHQLDELQGHKTPYDYIVALMPDATEAQKRARLGSLGFGADKADTKCENLSGGEKARLLFALAAFHGPHLLILDEPTNHLDVDSREALIHALNDYPGAVVLISHDRHLIEACADRLWICRNGTVEPYDGDLDTYREACLSERGGPRRGAKSQGADSRSTTGLTTGSGPGTQGASSVPATREGRRIAAERRAEIAPLKKKIDALEARMTEIARKMAAVDARLADPAFYASSPDKAQEYAQARGRFAKALAETEEAWLLASETYEAARAELADG